MPEKKIQVCIGLKAASANQVCMDTYWPACGHDDEKDNYSEWQTYVCNEVNVWLGDLHGYRLTQWIVPCIEIWQFGDCSKPLKGSLFIKKYLLKNVIHTTHWPTRRCTCMHARTYTQTHLHIHAHTLVHIYVCTNSPSPHKPTETIQPKFPLNCAHCILHCQC